MIPPDVYKRQTEFFPAADNSRIGINLQLPIGARVERAEALASELTNK